MKKKATIIITVIAMLAASWWLSAQPWHAPDWMNIYRPGALASQPNSVRGNFAPPWTYLVLYPFAILPDQLSKFTVTLATLIICRLYIGGTKRFLALCATMPFMAIIAFGQIDALALVGLMVPADIAIMFLAMKPQAAILTALNEKRRSIDGIAIGMILFVFSLLIWGWWPAALLSRGNWGTDCSLWPYGIPFGLLFLYRQWKRGFNSDTELCAATLLLSPYFFYTSMLPLVACAIKERDDWREWLIVAAGSWVFLGVAGVGLA